MESSSGSSPLSIQLQRAWLEAQLHSWPPLFSSTETCKSSFYNQSSYTSRVAPPLVLAPEEDAVMDPSLQFINDMLMDENMEDRTCMAFECSAYQAMAKGFYEILGEDASSLSSLCGRKLPSTSCDGSDPDLGTEEYYWINGVLNPEPEETWVPSPDKSPLARAADSVGGPASLIVDQPQFSPEWSYASSGSNGDLAPSPVWPIDLAEILSESKSLTDYAVGGDVAYPQLLSNADIDAATLCQNSNVQHALLDPLGKDDLFQHIAVGMNENLPTGKIVNSLSAGDQNGKMRTFSSEKHLGNILPPSLASDEGIQPTDTHTKSFSDNKSTFFEVRQNDSSNFQTGRVSALSQMGDVEASVSFVENEDLNAECSARLHRDEPLTCDRSKTQRQHNSTTKQRLGNGSSMRPPPTLDMVDLRGLLISCAQAVATDDLRRAHDMLQVIREHACPHGSHSQRLAHYFAEALVARLSGTGPRLYTALRSDRPSAAQMLKAFRLYVEVAPFITLCHFFGNQSILKAAEGSSRLHIVDYGILYGLQWPSLISALAERKGGPPHLRITGIDFPLPGFKPAERIEESGRRLSEYAQTYGVPFEFHAIACKWENVQPAMLNLRAEELLIVNSMQRLRHLADETVMAVSPRKTVLENMRQLNPKIFVVGVVNAGLNAPFFLSRFREALFYFSSKMDIVDTMMESENVERLRVERELIGRDILNVVACEGLERVERPETYRQWQSRIERAGFEAVDVDDMKKRILRKGVEFVKRCYHKDFSVDGDGKWMSIQWKGRTMHAVSTWSPKPKYTD